jgi:flagellar biosynthesis protein FlhG
MMSDQADGLRELVRARSGTTALAEPPEKESPRVSPVKARSLVFTSGKGGVGTSNLALNLAIALGELGRRVVLVDADLGLANIDLLSGLIPLNDLGDVLSGSCTLDEALMEGPASIRVLPGAHAMRALPEVLGDGPSRVAAELAQLEQNADFLIVDAGSGLGAGIATLAAAADEIVVVTSPEPTSIADAHATLGRFRRLPGIRLRSIVNQAGSAAEANSVLEGLSATARQFLGTVVEPLGFVRADVQVRAAVRARRPFVLANSQSVASRGVRRIARDLISEQLPRSRRPGFFAALAARWALSRVAR